ncbi:MAG: MFS transporter, partial [Paracoccaceae bacterium]
MAQAVLGSQMPMLFTVAGLAGTSLASNICFVTLPISLIVLGSMLSATPVSAFMQRYGRTAGFMLGTAGGAVGGAIGAYGLYVASFPIFLAGSFLTGMYMSAQGFYRFAATDTAPEGYRPKAISYVMAGGLASALIGPQMVKLTVDAWVVPFMGTYAFVVGLNVVGSLLFLLLDIPKPAAPAEGAPKGRTRWELITTPRILVAVICGMVSYALMN